MSKPSEAKRIARKNKKKKLRQVALRARDIERKRIEAKLERDSNKFDPTNMIKTFRSNLAYMVEGRARITKNLKAIQDAITTFKTKHPEEGAKLSLAFLEKYDKRNAVISDKLRELTVASGKIDDAETNADKVGVIYDYSLLITETSGLMTELSADILGCASSLEALEKGEFDKVAPFMLASENDADLDFDDDADAEIAGNEDADAKQEENNAPVLKQALDAYNKYLGT